MNSETERHTAPPQQTSLFPGIIHLTRPEDSKRIMEAHSRYIRSNSLFEARTMLRLEKPQARIRFFSEEECVELAGTLRRRSLFARLPYDNNFYIGRIGSLAESTISEVFLPGQPRDIIPNAVKIATCFDKIALLSTTFVRDKLNLQPNLGFNTPNVAFLDMTIGPRYYSLKSSSRSERAVQPIVIDDSFCNRFERNGFPQLVNSCVSNDNGIAPRVGSAVDWLFESRMERLLSSSIVKTAIALESLLIFDESEPLTRALSERIAFIISSDPQIRRRISDIVRRFYDARSGVVHGGRKRVRSVTPELIEGIDRITLLTCLTIAANPLIWNSNESLREWFEAQRWGSPDLEVKIPFPTSYLKKALDLAGAK